MPRRIASASDSFPENGIAAELLVLPPYAPDTEIVGFIAFTLVVVLGTGASVATTPPLCPLRPESGSAVGRVLGGGGPPSWAKPHVVKTKIEAATATDRARETFEVNGLIFSTMPFA